ncbi:MAG: FRG domain-containing protein [Gammaproteobacteria bacterium]|nr:FRG domain-containing protein [Gammaproteobacteria bacterium]
MKEIIINDWSEIFDLEINFPLDYFRGQSSADWDITSSLQRLLKGTDYEEDPSNTEFWLLRDFKRGAGLYLNDLPAESDLVSWLSLMQHYGAPTRLIDFTQSFYVACYFALSGAEDDAAVWAIDPFLTFDIAKKVFKVSLSGLRDEWDDLSTKCGNEYLNKILATAEKASHEEQSMGVIAIQPYKMHTRLSIQQGIFMMPLDIRSGLIENLEPFVGSEREQIKKIILKKKVFSSALGHLKAMNITSESLFPGIEGFARSLAHKQVNKN